MDPISGCVCEGIFRGLTEGSPALTLDNTMQCEGLGEVKEQAQMFSFFLSGHREEICSAMTSRQDGLKLRNPLLNQINPFLFV